MSIQIKDRVNGRVLFEADAPSIRVALELAVKSGANLYGANLVGADLREANLREAKLDCDDSSFLTRIV